MVLRKRAWRVPGVFAVPERRVYTRAPPPTPIRRTHTHTRPPAPVYMATLPVSGAGSTACRQLSCFGASAGRHFVLAQQPTACSQKKPFFVSSLSCQLVSMFLAVFFLFCGCSWLLGDVSLLHAALSLSEGLTYYTSQLS